jgi:scyllo-inositol 2-dehydrogenase (NADP+)
MSKTIGVGLAGWGMAGRVFHAPLVFATPGLELAAVVERTGDTARRRYPGVAIVKDAESLFRRDDVELAVIATPNATHFELARAALLAGKHVVIDKPFTVSSGEARTLMELAKSKRRVLTVFQNRRWDGDFLTVSALVRAKRLGDLKEFASHFDRFRPELKPYAWRERPGPGAGLLYDLGPHLIDQALVLFGTPRSLSADIGTERVNCATDDRFEIALSYDALTVRLGAGMLAREPRPRFFLRGDAGSFVKYGLDPQEEALRRGETPPDKDWGAEGPGRWGTVEAADGGGVRRETVETIPGRYQEFYANVRAAIVDGVSVSVEPEQALETIRLIELAFESGRTGKNVEVHA